MYFLALATDYDGTIASDGEVSAETLAAMEAFKRTGRKLILVTGRRMDSLKRVFPRVTLFDRIVAENGALLYDPATEEEKAVAPPPSADLVELLTRRGVTPLSVGKSIVATFRPHETIVLEAIQELGLELQIIFNKGAVMVLPANVNKATGLAAALHDLELSPHNVVGVGDAENDHALLKSCGCSAAVANAIASLSDAVDLRLAGRAGAGTVELMRRIEAEDIRLLRPERQGLLLGKATGTGEDVYIEPYPGAALIAGSSGVGKSTLATALTERMAERGLDFCVFDPEGDYAELEHAVSKGDAKTPPAPDEILDVLRKLGASVVVNTQGLNLAERPEFFVKLLPQILSLRARTGRPQWLIVDEAHHLLESRRRDIPRILPEAIPAAIYVTVHPDAMAASALEGVEYVLALGPGAPKTVETFCATVDVPVPSPLPVPADDEVLFWARSSGRLPFTVKVVKPKQARDRHKRKYAEGELDADRSFYFRGREGKLNLRAQNLMIFVQLAEGLDEDTWQFHREGGHYSRWFGDVIKDPDLAAEAAAVEQDGALDATTSRERIIAAVERRYTASAEAPRNWREERDTPRPSAAPR